MKLEEIVTKLEQIEQQAALTISEYPHGLTVERQRLIVGLARQLRMHMRDQLRQGRRNEEPVVQDDTPGGGSCSDKVWRGCWSSSRLA